MVYTFEMKLRRIKRKELLLLFTHCSVAQCVNSDAINEDVSKQKKVTGDSVENHQSNMTDSCLFKGRFVDANDCDLMKYADSSCPNLGNHFMQHLAFHLMKKCDYKSSAEIGNPYGFIHYNSRKDFHKYLKIWAKELKCEK